MIGTGRGEILSRIDAPLKGKFMVVVKPDIHVTTAEAYADIIPRKPSQSIREVIERISIEDWKHLLVNDFEESVFRKFPAVGRLKNTLYQKGAVYASMSGSGSSVFGIFNEPVDVRVEFAGLTVWDGELLS